MEDIKKIASELEKEFTDHPDKNKIVGFTIGLITKHRNNPHPSDSDIEKMWPGEVWDEGKNELVRVLELNRARQEGAKWMRDRMNGEMCAFAEWCSKKDWYYHEHNKCWYGDNDDKGPEKTEQLLQKFRNR